MMLIFEISFFIQIDENDLQTRLMFVKQDLHFPRSFQFRCDSYLLSDKFNGLFIFKSEFNKGQSNHDGGPSKARDAVHRDAAVWIVVELFLEDFEPFVYNFVWWKRAVVVRQVKHLDVYLVQLVYFVGWFTNPHHCGHVMSLQLLEMMKIKTLY